MTNQETIFKLLVMEGDCWHVWEWLTLNTGKIYPSDCYTCEMGIIETGNNASHISKHTNPDLTTPEGVMWMLVRLPKWDRFKEFCEWLVKSGRLCSKYGRKSKSFDRTEYTVRDLIRLLATDVKDGKAPALFDALCEFEGLLEVKE